MVLAADILERVRRDFAGRDLEAAVALLEDYSGPERSRVLRCVLHLSGGALDKLKHFLRTAESDYRDVIMFAEYDSSDRRVMDFSRGFNSA